MKRLLLAAVAASVLCVPAIANEFTTLQTKPGVIIGQVDAKFETRTNIDTEGKVPEGYPALGATDTYTIDLTVNDVNNLRGQIKRLPPLPSRVLGRTIQEGYVGYNLDWIVSNADKSKSITAAKWVGAMKLDGYGKYHLTKAPEGVGMLRIAITRPKQIDSFFTGEIQGKVPENASFFGTAQKNVGSLKVTKSILRVVNGKTVKHVIKNADPMLFQNVSLAQGPVTAYPESRLAGEMNYDPEQSAWLVDLTAAYTVAGTDHTDRFSGSVRWVEDINRTSNGIGWYEINIRVNEPPASEADIVETAAGSSEEDLFAEDASIPGFLGKISYVDQIVDETVVGSKIKYAVDSSQTSKIQNMILAKVLQLMVGPFNDE